MHEDNMKNEQKLMVFRVVQEQLNNIIKYAEAKEISIRIKTEDDVVRIEVNDDGQGFDTTKIESGIGLRNIRSRLEVYAGNLMIDSAPGKGSRLKAEFSLV
jgi:two-component system sensor histidine kinase UhpB